MISSLRRDRWLQLFIAVAAMAVVVGLAVPPQAAVQLVRVCGYWTVLASFVWFAWVLFRLGRDTGFVRFVPSKDALLPFLLVGGCGIFLLVHEKFGFKILMDEVMLLGTSMGMHFDRQPLVPYRGNDLQGAFQLFDSQLDKRPLFHPFLVSCLHDLTGYRPENVFALNGALTFGLLALVFRVVRVLISRVAAVAAVLLLTTLPLLAQNATGGGFEMLNLVMIVATFALGLNYAGKRDALSQQALLLAGVLLAQTRYESLLFLLPVAGLVLWVWWREGRVILNWETVLVPLLLVPAVWHQKVFSARESAWEMASQPGFDRPFALHYAIDNFLHWLVFFFDTTGEHSNSLVLSILGWLALPFSLLASAKILTRLRQASALQATLALFTLGFAAHTALMLCYFWGRFDDPVIRRLSLPLNLWLVLAVVTVVSELFAKWTRTWSVLIAITLVGTMAYSLPSMSRHSYTLAYYVGRETEWRREFIRAHPERDYLFIDKNSIIWITHLVSATPVEQALRKKDALLFNFRNRTFTTIYVFQRYAIDPATGRQVVEKDDDLGPDFQLETYWERRFTPLTVTRISRVVGIKEGPTAPILGEPAPLEKMSEAEREKVRQDYFQRMLRELP